jgi:hypothetical protein
VNVSRLPITQRTCSDQTVRSSDGLSTWRRHIAPHSRLWYEHSARLYYDHEISIISMINSVSIIIEIYHTTFSSCLRITSISPRKFGCFRASSQMQMKKRRLVRLDSLFRPSSTRSSPQKRATFAQTHACARRPPLSRWCASPIRGAIRSWGAVRCDFINLLAG